MKKVGKTTKPFRSDLNQIPYDFTVKVTDIFKQLDPIAERLKSYAQRLVTLYRGGDQNHPKEKEMQEGKVVV